MCAINYNTSSDAYTLKLQMLNLSADFWDFSRDNEGHEERERREEHEQHESPFETKLKRLLNNIFQWLTKVRPRKRNFFIGLD